MLFQKDNTPYKIPTVTNNDFVTAIVTRTDTDTVIGTLKAFANGSYINLYLNSTLNTLAIKRPPTLAVKFEILMYDIPVKITAEGKDYEDIVTVGFPNSGAKLTNQPLRNSLYRPYQEVYKVANKVSNDSLFAIVNDSDPIKIDTLKVIGAGFYLVLNYHSYYEELGLIEGDTVKFYWEKLGFTKTIKFNAQYSEQRFHLVMRNQYGYFDCFEFTGPQINSIPITTNSVDLGEKTKVFSTESYEKVIINTGQLEQGEMNTIAENCRNGEFWLYSQGELFELILETKEVQKFNSKEPIDSLKLEFRFAENQKQTI